MAIDNTPAQNNLKSNHVLIKLRLHATFSHTPPKNFLPSSPPPFQSKAKWEKIRKIDKQISLFFKKQYKEIFIDKIDEIKPPLFLLFYFVPSLCVWRTLLQRCRLQPPRNFPFSLIKKENHVWPPLWVHLQVNRFTSSFFFYFFYFFFYFNCFFVSFFRWTRWLSGKLEAVTGSPRPLRVEATAQQRVLPETPLSEHRNDRHRNRKLR